MIFHLVVNSKKIYVCKLQQTFTTTWFTQCGLYTMWAVNHDDRKPESSFTNFKLVFDSHSLFSVEIVIVVL